MFCKLIAGSTNVNKPPSPVNCKHCLAKVRGDHTFRLFNSLIFCIISVLFSFCPSSTEINPVKTV